MNVASIYFSILDQMLYFHVQSNASYNSTWEGIK